MSTSSASASCVSVGGGGGSGVIVDAPPLLASVPASAASSSSSSSSSVSALFCLRLFHAPRPQGASASRTVLEAGALTRGSHADADCGARPSTVALSTAVQATARKPYSVCSEAVAVGLYKFGTAIRMKYLGQLYLFQLSRRAVHPVSVKAVQLYCTAVFLQLYGYPTATRRSSKHSDHSVPEHPLKVL